MQSLTRALSLALVGVTPLVLLRLLYRPVSDPDTFWHIRAGEYLWNTWSFTGPEPWSRFSSKPWVLHEWLPELVFFGAAKTVGLPGIAWITILAVLALYLSIYVACRSQAGIAVSGLLAFAACLGASAGYSPRPQLLSFILLALVTRAWLLTSTDMKPRWWLIPLTWLWAMSHGMWFTGVIVGLAVLAGIIMDGRADIRAVRRLALLPVLCLVAAAATPVGPRLLAAPFTISGYTKFVIEWDPPSVRNPYVAVTILMALVMFAVWARSSESTPAAFLALAIVALGWTLLYARTVAIGAVMLAPLTAGALQGLLAARAERSSRTERRTLLGATVVALTVAAVLAPKFAAHPGYVPSGLDRQLSALPRESIVFNDYSLGGWLVWRHRQLEPVIDGRAEVYDVAYVERYMATWDARPDWQENVRHSGARWALLRSDNALADALQHQLEWRPVGTDRGFVLLAAP